MRIPCPSVCPTFPGKVPIHKNKRRGRVRPVLNASIAHSEASASDWLGSPLSLAIASPEIQELCPVRRLRPTLVDVFNGDPPRQALLGSFQSQTFWTRFAAKSRSARFGMLRRLSTKTIVGRSPRSMSLFTVGRDTLKNRIA